jgi:glutamyl/glutaminyl-tRNA synthetase
MNPTETVSRIAPTPSGFLHIGNAANFLLTWLAVRLRGGRLLLRIDDLDRDRCRPEYVDDVFTSLEWLGIEPDSGPSGPADFYAHYSQTMRYDEYRNAMERMQQHGAHLFACDCSRKRLAGERLYPGTCRDAGRELAAMQTAMRIAVPDNTVVTVGREPVALDRTMGDFVLWRRDDIPAYQLVSVIEDKRSGVNLIVRGRDLFESSAAQLFLAPFLGAETFANATFLHHDLIRRPDGGKFSKSDLDLSLFQMRRGMGEQRARFAVFEAVLGLLGLPPKPVETPQELLEYCRDALERRMRYNDLLLSIAGTDAL